MDNRYEIAEQNGMSREFADWFFDNKKAGCGNVWFMMMAAMWEGWQGRAEMFKNSARVKPSIDAGYVTNNPSNCASVKVLDDTCRTTMLQGEPVTTANKLGNSPVIGIDPASGPDHTVEVSYVAPLGYVMVPKEPTEAMINAWLSEVANWRGHVAGYKAMLAAAPQEVK